MLLACCVWSAHPREQMDDEQHLVTVKKECLSDADADSSKGEDEYVWVYLVASREAATPLSSSYPPVLKCPLCCLPLWHMN
jgi:hypothetical protein